MNKSLIYLLMIILLFTWSKIYYDNNEKVADSTKKNVYCISDTTNYSDFQISYNWNDDEFYSSKDSIYRRLYCASDRKVKIGLTKKEKELLFRTALDVRFFSIPEYPMMEPPYRNPYFSSEIIIKIGAYSHRVYLSSEIIKDPVIDRRFQDVFETLRKILRKKREIKALPDSDISYA